VAGWDGHRAGKRQHLQLAEFRRARDQGHEHNELHIPRRRVGLNRLGREQLRVAPDHGVGFYAYADAAESRDVDC
jgi:hypothetical protein